MGYLKQWEAAKTAYEKAGKEAKKQAAEGEEADKIETLIHLPKSKTGLTPALRDLDNAMKEARYMVKQKIPITEENVWMPTLKKLAKARAAYGVGYKKLESAMGREWLDRNGVARYKGFTDASDALVKAAQGINKALSTEISQLLRDAGYKNKSDEVESSPAYLNLKSQAAQRSAY